LFAWSLGSDRSYEIACGSWSCSYCSRKKRAAVRLVVAEGCETAMARSERVRLMTLTDGTGGDLAACDFYDAWNRLRTRLRKRGLLSEYAAVMETTQAGALHLHALTTGRYIAQKRLSEYAQQAGFGKVADIRAVRAGEGSGEGDKRSAAYVSKELAGYLSKQKTDALRSKTATRRRRSDALGGGVCQWRRPNAWWRRRGRTTPEEANRTLARGSSSTVARMAASRCVGEPLRTPVEERG